MPHPPPLLAPGWKEKEDILEDAYAGLDKKHLPLKLPGQPLPLQQELRTHLLYGIGSVLTLAILYFLAPWCFSRWGLVYGALASVAWHWLATTKGFDHLLVDLLMETS
jgi:hypothetical protein